MTKVVDQQYLRTDQYRDASNLNVRMALHARFGTSKIGWHPWVFEQLELPRDAHILEIGCGPGQLWVQNLARIPDGWRIVLSDFSPGMVSQARQNLEGARHHFEFAQFDAQEIPFPDGAFDAVFANHMLYHVPDRTRTYREVNRVLKPHGRFYAATNGKNNMFQINELERAIGNDLSHARFSATDDFFHLESGEPELRAYFDNVTLTRKDETLLVTEVQPLVDYILSGGSGATAQNQSAVAHLEILIREEISRSDVFRIDKTAGLFRAEKRGE